MDLIKEAIKRGYKDGVTIQYGRNFGIDILGHGEFEIDRGRLIKYEYLKHERIDNDHKAFDTIYCPNEGWVPIVK